MKKKQASVRRPCYWTDMELQGGVVVEFRDKFWLMQEAIDHAVNAMSPMAVGWRLCLYNCRTLRNEYIMTEKDGLVKIKDATEVI